MESIYRVTVLDIETAPTSDERILDRIREGIKPPGNYKKPESIEEWHRTQGHQAFEDAVARTALDGMRGDVIAVGYQHLDFVRDRGRLRFRSEKPVTIRIRKERSVGNFLHGVMGPEHVPEDGEENAPEIFRMIAGHNIAAFDLPFMWQQCLRHRVEWPRSWPVLPKPWSNGVMDTMFGLVGTKATISLKDAAYALGVRWDEASIPSAEVPKAWDDEKDDLIEAHLKNDLLATAEITKILIEADERGVGWEPSW